MRKTPEHTLHTIPLSKLSDYSIVAEHLVEKMEEVQIEVKMKLKESKATYKVAAVQHYCLKVFVGEDQVMVHL